MNDMSVVIAPKSDQLNADDMLSGSRTVTIEKVVIKPGTEQPISISIKGEKKVYRPCKSMARVMVSAWGPDAKVYEGRSMTLYCDTKVAWGGMAVGGIRISHVSHIERDLTLPLTEKKGIRKPFTVKVLKQAPVSTQQQQAPADAAPAAEAPQPSFLDRVKDRLAHCQNAEQVDKVEYAPAVQQALNEGSDEIIGQLHEMLAAARKRLEPVHAEAGTKVTEETAA